MHGVVLSFSGWHHSMPRPSAQLPPYPYITTMSYIPCCDCKISLEYENLNACSFKKQILISFMILVCCFMWLKITTDMDQKECKADHFISTMHIKIAFSNQLDYFPRYQS